MFFLMILKLPNYIRNFTRARNFPIIIGNVLMEQKVRDFPVGLEV